MQLTTLLSHCDLVTRILPQDLALLQLYPLSPTDISVKDQRTLFVTIRIRAREEERGPWERD